MANLRRRPDGPYHLEFRYAGHKFQRSLGTTKKKEADRLNGIVEQTASHLDLGVLSIPPRSTTDDRWRFLASGGKTAPEESPLLVESASLEEATEEHLDSYAEGAKKKDTLQTERTHLSHFVRLIGKSKQVGPIEPKTIEAYIKRRQQARDSVGGKSRQRPSEKNWRRSACSESSPHQEAGLREIIQQLLPRSREQVISFPS